MEPASVRLGTGNSSPSQSLEKIALNNTVGFERKFLKKIDFFVLVMVILSVCLKELVGHVFQDVILANPLEGNEI